MNLLNQPSTVDPRVKDAFWGVVRDCLVQIHKVPPADADQKTTDLRNRIERPPPGINPDMVYHDEPFDVACDIAGNKLDLATHRGQYDPILRAHNW